MVKVEDYQEYIDEVLIRVDAKEFKTHRQAALAVWDATPRLQKVLARDTFRKKVNQMTNEQYTSTTTNQYQVPEKSSVLSARKSDGGLMNIKEYCEHWGIPQSEVKSYKLVTHTGTPYYNIASHNVNDPLEGEMTLGEMKQAIKEELVSLKKVKSTYRKGAKKVGVVTLSDLHFGAYVDNLVKTQKFSISILSDYLKDIALIVNSEGFSEVHLHFLGDMIESFTGLNHKNSWKGLQKGMFGAEVIKLCVEVLHNDLLSKIDNLKEIKMIGGNHDRLTADKTEDTEGGACNLIAWGLELIGYPVEFHPFVINHEVDGISYILMHGHHPISKKPTKDLCWDFGKQGMFNVVCEGHLHSYIQKLSVKQAEQFSTVRDSSVDNLRIVFPSLFTGNSFSEYLGYTTTPGFIIMRNLGTGVPYIGQYPL